MFRIEWRPIAFKQLRKIPHHFQRRIVKAVRSLETPDTARNVTKLKGHEFNYRMRVGNYRILFDIDHAVRIVSIEEVKKRDERTY